MARRREQVLDAAVEVLAADGLRGLTYQAVDAAAGVPAGTASNHFRNRDALLTGVVDHLLELDRREVAALGPADGAGLADVVAAFVGFAVGPGRARTTARYALALGAAGRPELRDRLAAGRAEITTWGVALLADLGSPRPRLHAELLIDFLDGLILHEITYPVPGSDPEAKARHLVHLLLDDPAW